MDFKEEQKLSLDSLSQFSSSSSALKVQLKLQQQQNIRMMEPKRHMPSFLVSKKSEMAGKTNAGSKAATELSGSMEDGAQAL
jgi:hypothetical protein